MSSSDSDLMENTTLFGEEVWCFSIASQKLHPQYPPTGLVAEGKLCYYETDPIFPLEVYYDFR